MFVGPVFSREALTAPRRIRFYAVPCLFVAVLLGLTLTAWQVLVGAQNATNPGDLARFGAAAFALLAPLQLTVCLLFSALLAAAAISQEKDRKTLILLLLSDLSNAELVLGKLLASMLSVLMVIATAAPFFLLLTLLGGVSYAQVARVTAVIAVASIAAGSLGSTVALWREKTFQALAITGLVIVLWLVGWEVISTGALGATVLGVPATLLAGAMSPWRAVQVAVEPAYVNAGEGVVAGFLAVGFVAIVLLNTLAIMMVRVWNPSRETRSTTGQQAAQDDRWLTDEDALDQRRRESHKAPGKLRRVWDNPILWREVRTWAYGKKILAIKFGYLLIFGLCAVGAALAAPAPEAAIPPAATLLAPLLVLSVVLVNAMSVTSITGERDLKSLDLLLATDLTPKELIFGKLGGAVYNAKEMILLPMALCVALWWSGRVTGENLAFLLGGLAVVNAFAAVLGLHAGMIYPNSRQAIAASIGTLLFLFLGVTTCMRMMLALSQSFEHQLIPFLGFVLGGGIALFAVLAWRNPSRAMALACFTAPFAVFYAIVSYLLGNYDWVFLSTVASFGFATAAMLVPALSEFDVATGRTAARDA